MRVTTRQKNIVLVLMVYVMTNLVVMHMIIHEHTKPSLFSELYGRPFLTVYWSVRSQGRATRRLRPMAFNQKILLLSGEYDHGHFKAINRLSVIGFTWILLNVNFKKLDWR